MLEHILDVIDPRFLPFRHDDLDHVEPPRQFAGSQLLEPCVRPALDQSLFFPVHGIETADPASLAAGFDLDEKQQLPVPCDDIHLATSWPAIISGENPAALGPQPSAGNLLAEGAGPDSVTRLAVRCRQAAG